MLPGRDNLCVRRLLREATCTAHAAAAVEQVTEHDKQPSSLSFLSMHAYS